MPQLYTSHGGANYKLASAKVPRSGTGVGGLQPVLLSGNAMGRISTPRVNVNVGNVKYTGTPPPEIVLDSALRDIENFGIHLSNAAFRYEQREAAVHASRGASEYMVYGSNLLNGTVDEDNNPVLGYKDIRAIDAISAYPILKNKLDIKKKEILSGLSPLARQKASLYIEDDYNIILQKAAEIRTKKLEEAELNAYMTEGKVIHGIANTDPVLAWEKTIPYAEKSGDLITKDQILVKNMELLLTKVENNTRASIIASNDPELMNNKEDIVFNAVRDFFYDRRKDLPETAATLINSKLIDRYEVLQKNRDERHQKNLDIAKEYNAITGPDTMAGIFGDGLEAIQMALPEYIEQMERNYKDEPVKGEELLEKIMKGALNIVTRNKGLDHAKEVINNLDTIETLSADLKTKLKIHGDSVLVGVDKNARLDKTNAERNTIIKDVRGLNNLEDLKEFETKIDANHIKHGDNYILYKNILKGREKELKNEFTAQEKENQGLYYSMLSEEARGGIDRNFRNKTFRWLAEHKITVGQREKLIKQAGEYSSGTSDPESDKVRGRFKTIYKEEAGDWIYDPEAKEVIPIRMLDKDRAKDIAKNLEKMGIANITDPIYQNIMVDKVVQQFKDRKRLDESLTVEKFYEDIVLQSPEAKVSRIGKWVREGTRGFVNDWVMTLEEPFEKPGPSPWISNPESESFVAPESLEGVTSIIPEALPDINQKNAWIGFLNKELPVDFKSRFHHVSFDDNLALYIMAERVGRQVYKLDKEVLKNSIELIKNHPDFKKRIRELAANNNLY